MLFPGRGGRGDRKDNGQNWNEIVSGCDNKYNYFNEMGKFVPSFGRTACPHCCLQNTDRGLISLDFPWYAFGCA